ncbi:MAG TPA: Fe-S cluster assembly protein SufD [Planctomycetota bacterium]
MDTVAMESLATSFEAGAGRGEEPNWLSRLRRDAFDLFLDAGLPRAKDEDWRWTRLDGLAATRLVPALPNAAVSKGALESRYLFEPSASRLVFVDGRFRPEFSVQPSPPRGVHIQPLRQATSSEAKLLKDRYGRRAGMNKRPFLALNAAFFDDGALLRLDDGAVLDHPLHLVFYSTGTAHGEGTAASHPRALIVAGRRSRATIVETHFGPDGVPYLANSFTELHAGEGASIDHLRVQEEGDRALSFGQLDVYLAGHAEVHAHAFAFGAALCRQEVRVRFAAPGGRCTLEGLAVVGGSQHVDTWTEVDHSVPDCKSTQAFRSVLADRSRGVFRGGVIVRQDAQHTIAEQSNKNLLLSAEASADSKPALEIHADDVKCSHGVAIGQLDGDALFYLRSRGLGPEEARNLLVRAFVGAITATVRVPALRCRIDRMLATRLAVEGLEPEPMELVPA